MGTVIDRLYTAQQIRRAEEITMRERGIPEQTLIETAAEAVAGAALAVIETNRAIRSEHASGSGKSGDDVVGEKNTSIKVVRVAVLAGRGNNGADALAAARMLVCEGCSVDVFETPGERCSSGYQGQRGKLAAVTADGSNLSLRILTLSPEIDWTSYDIVIDGLFGIGLNRPITGLIYDTILSLNSASDSACVISVDVPSGVDADTGAILGIAVKASVTVTFTAEKTGLSLYAGRTYAGQCIVADAGIPLDTLPGAGYPALRAVPKLPERDPAGHKGSFGRILIVAGSETGPGACMLASKACYRSGAGLCKLVAPKEVLPEVLRIAPETVFCERKRFLSDPEKQSAGYKVCLIGPGLGTDEEASKLLDVILADSEERVVILDADALNLLSKRLKADTWEKRIEELSEMLPKQCVLTPHPTELARLLGLGTSQIAELRLAIADRWREVTPMVLVMKDAATLVAGDDTIWFNETGNDGMGTAGSGDVLAGILAAMSNDAARGVSTLAQCAAAAVAIHGTAGDLCAEEIGRRSLTAGDIVRYLPKAFGAPKAVEKGTDD